MLANKFQEAADNLTGATPPQPEQQNNLYVSTQGLMVG